MNLQHVRIIMSKEVVDNSRDWGSLASSFGMALLVPIMFAGMMKFMIDLQVDLAEQTLELPVQGVEFVPELAEYLRSANINVEAFKGDAVAEVTSGDREYVLLVSDDFILDSGSGKPGQLELIYNSQSLGTEQGKIYRIESVIREFSTTWGALRLLARGIDANLLAAINLNQTDLAPPGTRVKQVLSSVPFMILISAFMGVFYLAIDTTAGEREKGSLEPLLTLAVKRSDIVLGKIAASSAYGFVSLTLTLVLLALSLRWVPMESAGIDLDFGVIQAVKISVLVAPIVLIASSTLTLVASFTKSFKEAQTYLSLVILLPTMPLLVATFTTVKATWLTMTIPSLSQALIIEGIFSNNMPAWHLIATSIITSTIVAAILCWCAVALYCRENILGKS